MKQVYFVRMSVVLYLLFAVALCSFAQERPIVNIPMELRQENWLGRVEREGSCVWASTISLLHWQGRHNTAEWLRRTRGDGETPLSFAKQLDEIGIRYAHVFNGDVAFLEWACRTRRGAAVTIMGGQHMVTLVHLDEEWAAILNNNNNREFIWIPREKFIAAWKFSLVTRYGRYSGGWAVTPIYTPAAPLPR